jgi:hypothetical protein
MNTNYTKELLLSTPLPQETRSYKPISHEQLIDLTLAGIEKSGFKLETELYSSAQEGNIANGRYTISNVADSEMKLQIGWQNSYNKQLTLKFALGTQIIICQNGMVSGDFGAFKKKHVGEIQTFTPQAITDYIKSAEEAFKRIQVEREAMKQIEVDKRVISELIGRLYMEEELIQSTQLNIIQRELKKPTHNYGAEGSLWELYQFTTFSMKEIHPRLWMENHMNVHKFFTEQAGIILPSKQIEVGAKYKQLELFVD